jgi:hypothetical protein
MVYAMGQTMGLSWHAVITLAALRSPSCPAKWFARSWAASAQVRPTTAARWAVTARRLELVEESDGVVRVASSSSDPLDHLENSAWVRLTRALAQLDRPPSPHDHESVLAALGLGVVGDRMAAVSLGRRLQRHRPLEDLLRPGVLLDLVYLGSRSAEDVIVGHELFTLWRRALGRGDIDSTTFGQDCTELYRRGLLDVRWAQYPREGIPIENQVETRLGFVDAATWKGGAHTKSVPAARTGRP